MCDVMDLDALQRIVAGWGPCWVFHCPADPPPALAGDVVFRVSPYLSSGQVLALDRAWPPQGAWKAAVGDRASR